jgi:glycosyltransferase involved in cell wall biosynthesis
MPNILHISFYTGLYGAEQSLLTLVKGLSAAGHHSVVAVYQPGPLTHALEVLKIPVVYNPFFKPWLPGSHVNSLKRSLYNLYQLPFLFASAIALRKVIRRYDVDLVHTSSAIIIDGALAAYITGIPHIWHIRETVEPNHTLTFFLGTSKAQFLIKRLSHRVLANSKAIAEPYILSEKDQLKVRVIYNGVSLAPYPSLSQAFLRQELGWPETVPVVGMVAQLMPLKRHEDFIYASSFINRVFPEVYFACVGGDPNSDDSFIVSLKNLVRKLGLEQRFIWLEHQYDIQRIFRSLDIVVLPSQEESFGRVLIEAMAAKRPVVATAVGGIPEVVIHGLTGYLVPVHQPEAIAEAVLTILQNGHLAQAMGQAGRRRVEEHFTDTQYVNSVVAIYHELLQQKL